MKKYQLFINGKWQNPDNNEWYESFNPYTNEPWALIPKSNSKDVDHACIAANDAFKVWSSMHPSARAAILRKLGDKLAEKSAYLAEIETKDNGKLYAETSSQTKYLPQYFYFYAGLGETIMGNMVNVDKPNHIAYTQYEPLGVVVTITAWNSPLMLVTWKIAPALAAGNTVVIKPSEFTSATAFELAKIVEEVGFPPGVINVVSGFGADIGNALISHPKVAKISFTGGTKTGTMIYSEAAKHIKKVSVELGGKSPNIVFNDANIDNAVKGAISGIFAASGQTCIAGSRLLLEENIHDEFVEKLVNFAKTAKLGNPMNADTQVGPVTTPAQFQKILDYIDIAKNEGATCVLGGKSVSLDNCPWFIEPTIFTNVKNNMRIAQEEVFGPVLAVIKFKGMDEAIEIANDIPFGLAAGVWTEDIKKALQVPKQIKAGTVWVNTYRMVSYLLPFGGYKQSGIGRENGMNVIYDYLQEKSVFISTEESTANPFVMK